MAPRTKACGTRLPEAPSAPPRGGQAPSAVRFCLPESRGNTERSSPWCRRWWVMDELEPEFFETMVEAVGVGVAIYGADGRYR